MVVQRLDSLPIRRRLVPCWLFLVVLSACLPSLCPATPRAATPSGVVDKKPTNSNPLRLLLKDKWRLPSSSNDTLDEVENEDANATNTSRGLRHHLPIHVRSLCRKCTSTVRAFCLNCSSTLPELWANCTSKQLPALRERIQWALAAAANHSSSSSAIALASGTSALCVSALTLLAYNHHVATTHRRILPRYRNLQLLSAVTAVDHADAKTHKLIHELFSLGSDDATYDNPPALVPIAIPEEEEEDDAILVLLWNGTMDSSSAVENGWYAATSSTTNADGDSSSGLGLYIQVSENDQVAVFVVANDYLEVKEIVEELQGTDWVAYVNNLLPHYDRQVCCSRELVASDESTVKKFAWQNWLKHQLLLNTDTAAAAASPSSSGDASSFLAPGIYTSLYREAVQEEELDNMMKRRRATFLSKVPLASKPSILVVEEPEEEEPDSGNDDKTGTERHRQRLYMERVGRMWYGGIVPFRARRYGWVSIVEKTTTPPSAETPQPTSSSRYFSFFRPAPPSPPPAPQLELRITWESSSTESGWFPRWGLGGKKRETAMMEEEQEVSLVRKRSLWPDIRGEDFDEEEDPSTPTKVLLLNQPSQGWSVWRYQR